MSIKYNMHLYCQHNKYKLICVLIFSRLKFIVKCALNSLCVHESNNNAPSINYKMHNYKNGS